MRISDWSSDVCSSDLFAEVPISRLTQGQFYDLANVQVLRGPQGVGFGRVTDGGNVMVSPQTPKEDFGGYVGVKVGNYGLRTVNGAINIPIRSEEHTPELQSLMRPSYAYFCL